jgi:hypothetical protein
MSRYALTLQTLLQAPANLSRVVGQIRSRFSNINVDVNVQANTRALANVNRQVQSISVNAREARREYSALTDIIGTGARRFAAISFATGTFIGLARSIKSSLKEAVHFETQMLTLSQVTGKTVSQLSDVSDEVARLSKGLGISSDGLLDTAIILSQAGYSAKQTKESLEVLAKTQLAASFNNIEETTEGAIAILSQFRKESIKAGGDVKFLEQSLGSINEVSKAFAVESSDLISTIRKTGGAFESAGGSLNELLALFTSVRATTRESAETIATGLRTIFTRIQRVDTISNLQKLGIELQDLEGKFVGPYEAVKRISEGLSSIDPRDIRFASITEELGGFRQIGKVIPLIKQFTLSQQALAVAQNATNSLSSDQAIAQKSLANQIARVKEEFQDLIRTFQKSESFQSLIKATLSIASAMIKVAESMEPILPLLTAFAGIQLGKGLSSIFMGAGQRSSRGGLGIKGFATGGTVPGSGNTDTVPAMLTPGEFVMKKSAVQKIGLGALHQMNSGTQYLNSGGVVKSSTLHNAEGIQGITSLRKKMKKNKRWGHEAGGHDDGVFLNYKTIEIDPLTTRDKASKEAYINAKLSQDSTGDSSNVVKGKAFENIVAKRVGKKVNQGNSYLDFPFGEIKSDAKFGTDIGTGTYAHLTLLSKALNSREDYMRQLTPEVDNFSPSKQDISLYIDKYRNFNKDAFAKKMQKKKDGGVVQHFADGGLVLNLKRNKFGGFFLNPLGQSDNYINTSPGGISVTDPIIANLLASKTSGMGGVTGGLSIGEKYKGINKFLTGEAVERNKRVVSGDGSIIDTDGFVQDAIKANYSRYANIKDPNIDQIKQFYQESFDIASSTLESKGVPKQIVSTFDDKGMPIVKQTTLKSWVTSNYQQAVGALHKDPVFKDSISGKPSNVNISAVNDVPALYPSGPEIKAGYRDIVNESIAREIPATIQRIGASIVSDGMSINQDSFAQSGKSLISDPTARASISGYVFEGLIGGLSGVIPSGQSENFDFTNVGANADKLSKVFGGANTISQMEFADAKSDNNLNAKQSILAKKIPNMLATSANFASYIDDVKYMATGGLAKGTDTVPAMLTPGEFVIKKASAQKIGYDNLKTMNSGGVTGFNTGGVVRNSGVQYFSKGSTSGPVTKDHIAASFDAGYVVSSPEVIKVANYLKTLGLSVSQVTEVIDNMVSSAQAYSTKMESGRKTFDRLQNILTVSSQVAVDQNKQEVQSGPHFQLRGSDPASRLLSAQMKNQAAASEQATRITHRYKQNLQANMGPIEALSKAMQTVAEQEGGLASDTKTLRKMVVEKAKSYGMLAPGNSYMGPGGPGGPPAKTPPTEEMRAARQADIQANNERISRFTSKLSSSALTIGILSSSAGQLAAQFGGLNQEMANAIGTASMTFSAIFGIGSAMADILPDSMGKLKLGMAGLSIGIGAGMAAVELFTASLNKAANDSYVESQKMIKSLSEGGKVTIEDLRAKVVEATGNAARAENATANGRSGALAGAIALGGAGVAAGTFIPGLGNIVGGVGGAIAGGVLGGLGGSSRNEGANNEQLKAAEASANAQYMAIKSVYEFNSAMDHAKLRALDGAETTSLLADQTASLIKQQKAAEDQAKKAESYYKKLEGGGGLYNSLTFGLMGERGLSEKDKKQRQDLESVSSEQKSASIKASSDLGISILGRADELSKSGGSLNDVMRMLGPQIAIYGESLIATTGDQDRARSVMSAFTDGLTRTVNANAKLLESSRALNESLAKQRGEAVLMAKSAREFSSMEFDSSQLSLSLENVFASIAGDAASFRKAPIQQVKEVGNIDAFARNIDVISSQFGDAGRIAKDNAVKSARLFQRAQEVLLNRKVLAREGESIQSGQQLVNELNLGELGLDEDVAIGIRNALAGIIKDEGGNTTITQPVLEQVLSRALSRGEEAVSFLNKGLAITTDQLDKFSSVLGEVNESSARLVTLNQNSVDIRSRFDENASKIRGEQPGDIQRREAARQQRAQVSLGRFGLKANDVAGLGQSISDARKEMEGMNPQSPEQLKRFSMLGEQAKAATARLQELSNQTDLTSDVMSKFEKIQTGINQRNSKIEDFILGGQESRGDMGMDFAGLQKAMATGTFQTLNDEMRGRVSSLLDSLSEVEVMPGLKGDDIKQALLAQDFMRMGATQDQASRFAGSATTSDQERLIGELRAISLNEQAANAQLINVEQKAAVTLLSAAQLIEGTFKNFSARMPAFNSGGSVGGVGNKDNVQALLTPGEFVIRKAAVDEYGLSFLNSLNNKSVQKKNDGGFVRFTGRGSKEIKRAEELERQRLGAKDKLQRMEEYEANKQIEEQQQDERKAKRMADNAKAEAINREIMAKKSPPIAIKPKIDSVNSLGPMNIPVPFINNRKAPERKVAPQRQLDPKLTPRYQELLALKENKNMREAPKSSFMERKREEEKARREAVGKSAQMNGGINVGLNAIGRQPVPQQVQPRMQGQPQQQQQPFIDVAGLTKVSDTISGMAGKIEKVVNTLNGMKMEHTVKFDGILSIGGLDIGKMKDEFKQAISNVVIEEVKKQFERRV